VTPPRAAHFARVSWFCVDRAPSSRNAFPFGIEVQGLECGRNLVRNAGSRAAPEFDADTPKNGLHNNRHV